MEDWRGVRPWDSGLFVLIAALVAWLHRRAMFTRAGAVTELVEPGHGAKAS